MSAYGASGSPSEINKRTAAASTDSPIVITPSGSDSRISNASASNRSASALPSGESGERPSPSRTDLSQAMDTMMDAQGPQTPVQATSRAQDQGVPGSINGPLPEGPHHE